MYFIFVQMINNKLNNASYPPRAETLTELSNGTLMTEVIQSTASSAKQNIIMSRMMAELALEIYMIF